MIYQRLPILSYSDVYNQSLILLCELQSQRVYLGINSKEYIDLRCNCGYSLEMLRSIVIKAVASLVDIRITLWNYERFWKKISF